MRLNRTHLVPVLAIVAGGVLGASLSFSFLGSRSDDVPGVTLGLLYESSTTKESPRRLEDLQRLLESNDRTEEVRRLLERDRVERVEETLESVRDQVEEARRLLERIQEGSDAIEFRMFTIDSDVTILPNTVRSWMTNESGVAASRITFSRRTEDGTQDLYVIDSDGENLRRLGEDASELRLEELQGLPPIGGLFRERR